LPDVFETLGSTAAAQAGSTLLALLGIAIISFALARYVLWVEFGERIRVRRAVSERVFDWNEVASLALEEEKVEVRPVAPLAALPGALGVPAVGAVARLAGVADLARFDLSFRRLCIRLSGNNVIRCDVRLLEWENVAEMARGRSIPMSE
jgi:hypothetical protein